jgi:ATP-dependent DNA helicase RecQ
MALDSAGIRLARGSPKRVGVDSDTCPDVLLDVARTRFGLTQLHGFQREAVGALLGEGARVLLVAPTGGGKSLCYQLPAVMLEGTALVLSPLISLMEDQVRALSALGVDATFLASTLPREENGRRLAALRRGALRVVYAAPERLQSEGFLEALASVRLSLVAVDEAHCIVQWGHDFRPEYLRIGEALGRISPPRVIACTATATPDAREEIARRLGWEAGSARLLLRGFARPNLHLSVQAVHGPRQAEEKTAGALAEVLGDPLVPRGAAIVYAATRRGTERLADSLRERGWDAAAYHAGLPAELRARVSAAFAERTLPVVVATNAFGMGIDRRDVRLVVHAQLPPSIEGYYQEVGRAGRDGAEAHGVLLFSGMDIVLRRRLAALGEGGAPADPEQAARSLTLFREMLHYVDAATCRHDFVLRYFGDEAESLGGCGHCDVCRDVFSAHAVAEPAALEEDRDVVRRALAGVARARGSAGLQAVAAMLAGERGPRVVRAGLDRLSTFGVLAGRALEDVMAVLRVLLANGWIDLTPGDFPVPVITDLGWKVLKEGLPVLRLPRVLCAPGARRAPPDNARSQAARPSTVEDAVARGMDRGLFDALSAHRAAVARVRGVPVYVVAPNRTLTEIAMLKPRSLEDLAMVHGMGPGRIAAYGEGLLSVVKRA